MNEEENLTQEEQEPGHEEQPSTPSPRGRSVFPYLAVLFATAFLLLLFAYLMQQRDSEEIRGNLSDLRESMGSIQSIDQLREENHALRGEKENLESRIAELEKQVSELEGSLADSEDMEEQWQGRYDDAKGIVNAFYALNLLHELYDQGNIAWCKSELERLEGGPGVTGARVEDYLDLYVSSFAAPVILEDYNPLEDWLALKEAILEAEIEE